MNLRRLNYILIPRSTERFDALTHGPIGRRLRHLMALTPEGQILTVATLVSAAAGIDVRFSHLYLVFCGLFGLLLAAFLCRPLARIRELDVRVEHPPRLTAGETATFTVVLRNTSDRDLWHLRVSGPFLPWDGTWTSPRPGLAHLPAGAEARVTLTARFTERGDRYLGRFTVASVRPLGLMRGTAIYTDPVRLTVVPRIIELHAPAPAPVAALRRGAHRAGAGESFELLGVRPYRTGDRIRDLHARSWARLGEPMVREYRQPHERRIRVALHAATDHRETLDAACTLAASLIAHANRAHATTELVTLGPDGVTHLTIGPDAAALDRALDLLATLEPGELPPDLAADADAHIAARLAPGERLWLILTDDATPAPALAARAPDLRPLHITRRRRDAHHPPGARTLTPADITDGLALVDP